MIRSAMEQTFKVGEAWVEADFISRDQTKTPYLFSGRLFHFDGKACLIGMGIDITERKQAEELLLLEKTFIDAIFNSIPGMLYLYDTEGRLIRWNKKHELMTGYPPEEIVKMQLLDWFKGDAESLKAVTEGVQETMLKGFGDAEANLQKKDGTTIPMYFTASRLTINEKQYFTGIGIDITERKNAEEEKEKLQEQLLQAIKMESVGRLAGGVAHDFNNMLTGILGHTELAILKCASSEHKIHSDLKSIQTSALRAADLVRQLLAFARKQTVAPKVLDVNDAVTSLLKMLRRMMGEDIDLVWTPKAGLWPIKIDPSQLDQILTNLCVNARDAIAGTGKVTIETGNCTFDEVYCTNNSGFVPGDYVMLAVSDNGSGISKEVHERIFEPFFTTKEMGKGTGLGLATVYGIVKQNEGFINVYSETGEGSTFKIYLSRVGEEVVADMIDPKAETPKGQGEMLLLVEDEEIILAAGRAMLEQLGYTVLSASTATEALRLAKDHRDEIQLLLSDVIMPEMNGRDLAKLICNIIPRIKCLFTSGYTSNVIAHHGILDAGVHFLQKPFSIEDLAINVRQALLTDTKF